MRSPIRRTSPTPSRASCGSSIRSGSSKRLQWKSTVEKDARVTESFENLQGMLAADARASTLAWGVFGALPPVRHSSEPNEPQYLHDMRADVHEGVEGPEDHDRRDHLVCGSERLHQPLAVPILGSRLTSA